MTLIPQVLTALTDELQKLPGIGPRTAERLGYFLLRAPVADVKKLGELLSTIRDQIITCEKCFNVATSSVCEICSDPRRNEAQVLVVEEPLDTVAIEKTNRFQGVYHVLGGVIDPLRGVGVEELRIAELIKRIENRISKSTDLEIILATNPSTEGETTAIYIRKIIKEKFPDHNIIITRLARGLPVGAELEYADPVTIMRSLEGRSSY